MKAEIYIQNLDILHVIKVRFISPPEIKIYLMTKFGIKTHGLYFPAMLSFSKVFR